MYLKTTEVIALRVVVFTDSTRMAMVPSFSFTAIVENFVAYWYIP